MKLLPFILLLSAVAIPIALADGDGPSSTDTTEATAATSPVSSTAVDPKDTTQTSEATSPVSSTPVDPKDTTQTSAATSPVSSTTVDPKASTQTAASSQATQATATNIVSTTGVPTTTTLPQVNVSYADFQRSCVPNGDCTFEYTVPNNSPQYLNAQEAILDSDKTVFGTYSSLAATEETKFNTILETPMNQLNDLKNRVQAAQNTLQQLSDLLSATEMNQDMIQGNLTIAQIRLNQLRADRSSCYYQACFVATPPPTPTKGTTTTPIPTASPCDDDTPQQMCPDQCAIDDDGLAYCTKCDQGGNIDGHKFCQTSAAGSRISCDLGLFVSPDYYPGNSTRLDGSTYLANSVYSWVVNQNTAQVSTSGIILSITEPATLTITATGDNMQQTITSTRVLKAIFNLYEGPYVIELKTGSSNDTTSVFAFQLIAR